MSTFKSKRGKRARAERHPETSGKTPVNAREIMPDQISFTIAQICIRQSISRTTYNAMRKRGEGPTEMHFGRNIRISAEEERKWQARLTAGGTAAQDAPPDREQRHEERRRKRDEQHREERQKNRREQRPERRREEPREEREEQSRRERWEERRRGRDGRTRR